jgi:phage protein D
MATEATLSRFSLYSARPTLRLGGERHERLDNLLIGLRMEEDEGGLSRLELRFGNWVRTGSGASEAAFGPDSALRLGADIAAYTGDELGPQAIFQGRVSAIEVRFTVDGAPECVVLAEDALQGARLARRSAVYEDCSPADVVRRVATELGLRPVITGLDAPIDTWAQINQSDLAFLRQLLARFDADLQIVGSELQVAPRSEVARGEIALAMFGQLIEARAIADLADQVTGTSAAGWNASDGAAVTHEATQATHPGPGRGRTGAQWLADTFGERHEHLGHLAVRSSAEAEAVACAAFDARARRFVRVHGLAQGNPALRVGTTVALSGLSAWFDNRYRVTAAVHQFDGERGYTTAFDACCAYLGA